jgi:transketolase
MAATREALGPTLVRLAQEGLDIVVVDVDPGVSTTAVSFGRHYPDRFLTLGVVEQKMVGVAAGLAACSKTVFALGRCFDQLRLLVAKTGLNVKLVGSHGGVITGEDGASAQALDDLALVLSMPTFRVSAPADVVEAEQAIEATARHCGPFYIRAVRPKIRVYMVTPTAFCWAVTTRRGPATMPPSLLVASWPQWPWRRPSCWGKRTSTAGC